MTFCLTIVDRGEDVGAIVLESKWLRAWAGVAAIRQTAAAMSARQTPYGILVSRVLPAKQSTVFVEQGVIVVAPEAATAVATIVRDSIVALARMSSGARDRAAKEARLLAFVSSSEFTSGMRRIALKLAELRMALVREKAAHGSVWATRETAYLGILRESAAIDSRITEILRGASAEKEEMVS